MRIGIISKYYKNYNFGGLLQAYAMVKALESRGHHAEQISFAPDERKKYGIVSAGKICAKRLAREMAIRIKSKRFSSPYKRMKHFMKEIPHSKKVCGMKINSLNSQYDVFIAGSDQIWNPAFAYNQYFLKFAGRNRRKIAYAASIGITDLSEEEKSCLSRSVSSMDYISVREYEGKKLLEELLPQKKIAWVLDPVFLLTKEQWEVLDVKESMKLPEHYVALYLMGNVRKNKDLVLQITEELGFEPVIIPFTVSDYEDRKSRYNLGPKEFVTLIKYAEAVFTDSFHAVSFSMILGTDFYCLSRSGIDRKKSMNSRISDLFRMAEIPERWISCYDDYQNLEPVKSFEPIWQRIRECRAESFQYLDSALEGKGQEKGI